MAKTVDLKCLCGEVEGNLDVTPGDFFHVECICCDCQNFVKHLGIADKVLNEYGGTELFQTYPAYMRITKGQEQINCIKLHEKGIYRWHTTCCSMPLGNTMKSARAAFVGIPVKLMQFADQQEKDSLLGPITLKAFGKYSIGDRPKDAHPKFPVSYIPKILFFMLKGAFTKKYTPSPFFEGETPVSDISTLS